MKKHYVQYGCGLSAPREWVNYDISPTLRIQKLPVIGKMFRPLLHVKFPDNVRYGDIIKGLPEQDGSCDGLYCSHTLEHLSLSDLRLALKNSFRLLKTGGIFRLVLPDLESAARKYLRDLDSGKADASIDFMKSTLLGLTDRPRSLRDMASSFFGNSNHLWMWDHQSISAELHHAGFTKIRNCNFGDCEDEMFRHVEDADRFIDALAIECRK